MRYEPTDPSDAPEAVMIVSPSNRSIFAALATDDLCDLHALDPASRTMPRRRPT